MAKLSNTLIDNWTPDARITKWAEKHGFLPPQVMSDATLLKLARAYKGKPVGLYIWESVDHEIYIGISNVSVTRRLRQHVKDYASANIQSFRYRFHSGTTETLREIERELIYDALHSGFTVFNREHSAIIYGNSVFDEHISVPRQEEWFANPIMANANQPQRSTATTSATARSTRQYEKFRKLPTASAITRALSLHLRACTPFPVETERAYWSLTCLPGWSDKRLLTLNMGYLEMFWVEDAGLSRCQVNVGADYQFLPRKLAWFQTRRLGVKKTGPAHRAGGPNEEVLRFRSADAFVKVMTTCPEVRVAVARFALDRMRKGKVSGRYRDAHNSLLAGEALESMREWRPTDFVIPSE